jgi:hypothetical protein
MSKFMNFSSGLTQLFSIPVMLAGLVAVSDYAKISDFRPATPANAVEVHSGFDGLAPVPGWLSAGCMPTQDTTRLTGPFHRQDNAQPVIAAGSFAALAPCSGGARLQPAPPPVYDSPYLTIVQTSGAF